MRDKILQRFNSNIVRVRSLVTLYQVQDGAGGGRRGLHSADILRAAVVLLHATLEEAFRSIYLWKTPLAGEEFLNDVPLARTSSQRPEKFYLGKLAAFRGMSVDDLIKESVKSQANMLSVNNTSEIAHQLQRFGLRSEEFKQYMPLLEKMIERRHHIVHQADRNEARGRGQHGARSLGVKSVNSWIENASEFTKQVSLKVPGE